MNVTATPTATNAERARAFTAQVRANLTDLPTDELDDLLDGLGADLEERLSDDGDLGDPAQYAEELRQAAGLPPRTDTVEATPRRSFADTLDAATVATTQWFAKTPARRGFRDFMVTLRPVWWILRAALVTWFILLIIGHPLFNGLPLSAPGLIGFTALAILSVQWGRGKWLPRNWLRHLRTLANIAAVVLLLPCLALTANALTGMTVENTDYVEPYTPGLFTNGTQITNIFAYDCEGELLDSVRLYDQDGNPLQTTLNDPWGDTRDMPADFWDEAMQRQYTMGLNPLVADSGEWNVFPLTASEYSEYSGEPKTPEVVEPRRDTVAPLVRECPTPPTATEPDSSADSGTGAGTANTAAPTP